MYQGTVYVSTNFRPDPTSNMATTILENRKKSVPFYKRYRFVSDPFDIR
jgi:hypothetical protein